MRKIICDKCGAECLNGVYRHCMQCGEDACIKCAPEAYDGYCICDKCKAKNTDAKQKEDQDDGR
jgi:hypothetical protein